MIGRLFAVLLIGSNFFPLSHHSWNALSTIFTSLLFFLLARQQKVPAYTFWTGEGVLNQFHKGVMNEPGVSVLNCYPCVWLHVDVEGTRNIIDCLVLTYPSFTCSDWFSKEYWMIYRGPGFLSVVWFGSSPHPLNPPPTSPVSKLDWRHTGRLKKERQLADGWGGGWGAESYHSKKAWSSLNH